MRKTQLFLSLLCAFGIGSSVLAQSGSTAQDTVGQRIARQDSIEEARLTRVNAVTLTSQTMRDSISACLARAAASTDDPTPAATGTVYPEAAGQRLVYDTGNIIDVIRHSRYNLTAVCGHRGYFQEPGVPENSLKAIQRASDHNLEMVEIDVKMSKDGVPVLSHDFTVGRVTVGGNFNLVSSYNNGDLQRFVLKDINGQSTAEHMPTLEQALDYIRDHRIAIVVALDIKDRPAARACWEIVKRKQNAWYNPAVNWVIFKINATVYSYPPDLVYDLPGMVRPLDPSKPYGRYVKDYLYDKMLYVPVYATNMVDKLNCLQSQQLYKAQPFCIAFEINYKQEGGILTDQMDDIHHDSELGIHRTKATFNAIPDAPSVGADRFWKANGYETYRLQDIYYTAKSGKHDTDDKRGDWLFLTGPRTNFHWITTDKPIGLDHYLGGINLRNTSLYRPHPDGVDDEVDPHGRTSSRSAAPSRSSVTSPTLGVYPNPTAGNLMVTLNQAQEGAVQFRVTDQTGRTVLSQERKLPAGTQQVSLPNLRTAGAKPGLYLLQVTPGSGQPRQTMKVQVN